MRDVRKQTVGADEGGCRESLVKDAAPVTAAVIDSNPAAVAILV